MGFRDELGATKARADLLEKENAELREALDERADEGSTADKPWRSAPSPAEYVGAAFVTLTAATTFYASMVWWLPWAQPDTTAEEAHVAGLVGAVASAGISILFLCRAVFGWTRNDGYWALIDTKQRVAAGVKGLLLILFFILLFLFTDGDGV